MDKQSIEAKFQEWWWDKGQFVRGDAGPHAKCFAYRAWMACHEVNVPSTQEDKPDERQDRDGRTGQGSLQVDQSNIFYHFNRLDIEAERLEFEDTLDKERFSVEKHFEGEDWEYTDCATDLIFRGWVQARISDLLRREIVQKH